MLRQTMLNNMNFTSINFKLKAVAAKRFAKHPQFHKELFWLFQALSGDFQHAYNKKLV